MTDKIQIKVNSEVGELEGVILHTPGPEIENMTPRNVERALYSDILNLAIATKEYNQMKGVLEKITRTFEVKDLLMEILSNEKVKSNLVHAICSNEDALYIEDRLMAINHDELSRQLLEGVVTEKDTLTKFLDKRRYALRPLHNFFFTRDGSVSVYNEVLISRMASRVRERETIIMEAIFDYHPYFKTKTINPLLKKSKHQSEISIEGGDVLIARDDILLIGLSCRTSSRAIDYLIEHFKSKKKKQHIIVQELPHSPESFIHLDMVFTFLDKDTCMAYEPLVFHPNKFLTIHISIDNENVKIKEQENIVSALDKLGMSLKPVSCGGTKDSYIQEREQWHSGANFFALAPGKVIGYGRNINTIEALSNNGFEVLKAKDIIAGKTDPLKHKKCVVIIEGSELARGGGGCRCMTMPVRRSSVEW